MKLRTYKIDDKLNSLKVEKLGAVKLYYCIEGRNAWQSTWVNQYFEGCMHSTMESAKKFVEADRKQGSVFYIEELPALAFESDNHCLVVTQINSENPLSGYSVEAKREEVLPPQKKIQYARNNYLVRGALFEGVYLSFNDDSRFWNQAPAPRDSVIRVIANGTLGDFAPLERVSLFKFTSYSKGRYYPLQWSKDLSKYSVSAVLQLIAE